MAPDSADAEFPEYVRQARPGLRLYAYRMCADWYTADDLVQEAMIIMHRRWSEIQPPARVVYTRTTIAHLLCHERQTARWKRESVCDLLPERPQRSEEEEILSRLTVEAALSRLPERQRSVVRLRYLEELSTEETARTVGAPLSTVRTLLSRAMAALRAS